MSNPLCMHARKRTRKRTRFQRALGHPLASQCGAPGSHHTLSPILHLSADCNVWPQNWDDLLAKAIKPPFKSKSSNQEDTNNFHKVRSLTAVASNGYASPSAACVWGRRSQTSDLSIRLRTPPI